MTLVLCAVSRSHPDRSGGDCSSRRSAIAIQVRLVCTALTALCWILSSSVSDARGDDEPTSQVESKSSPDAAAENAAAAKTAPDKSAPDEVSAESLSADAAAARNSEQIARRIDAELARRWGSEEVQPVGLIADPHVLRRTTLDLAGRIPTLRELEQFLADDSQQRRTALVDRLLNSADYRFHQANELEALLLGTRGSKSEFLEYLREASAVNRPWSEMFRDMVAGNSEEKWKGGQYFLLSRIKEVDDMTNDTSKLFFGVSINCAQCHDHPLVADWAQDHYYGMKSFFSRTYATKSNILADKFSGSVKFTTTAGEEKPASFMFLSGKVISEPEDTRTAEQRKADDKQVSKQMKEADVAPLRLPDFRPREQLVRLALDDTEERFFARSIINRLWLRFYGRGLVDPPDQMHSENPASHPELLDWLAADLVQHGFDLKRTIRGMVLSENYLRRSEWSSESDPPAADLFAVAATRVLSPRQLGLSLVVATSNPDRWSEPQAGEDWDQKRTQLEQQAAHWANQFELPSDYFQVSVDEALLMSNNERLQQDLLRESNDRLMGKLTKLSPDEAIVTAYRAILTRDPTPRETEICESYLNNYSEEPGTGLRHLVWAMLASPEFRFNH